MKHWATTTATKTAGKARLIARVAAYRSFVFGGVVSPVASAGSRTIPVDSLTHLGGGGADALGHGVAGRVRLRAGPDSIGTLAVRRLIRFANFLQQR